MEMFSFAKEEKVFVDYGKGGSLLLDGIVKNFSIGEWLLETPSRNTENIQKTFAVYEVKIAV